MAAGIVILSLALFLSIAFYTTKHLRSRARAGVFLVYVLLYAFVFPLFLWLQVYFSADFRNKVKYPDGFKDYIYFQRENEKKQLPVNRDGLIADREYSPGLSDKQRVMILGDSFAAGYGLAFKNTLGAQLQELLGSGYEVMNGAFFGTNAEMQVEYFFCHLEKYKPEIIIIRHRMDDIMPLDEKYYLEMSADILRKYAPHWPLAVKNFFFRYQALLIRNKFWGYFRANTRNVIRENMLNYYDRLNNYTSDRRIRVLIVEDDCVLDYKDVCDAVETAAAKLKWDLLNPHEKINLSAPNMVIPGDRHPSACSNRFLSQFIKDYLKMNP